MEPALKFACSPLTIGMSNLKYDSFLAPELTFTLLKRRNNSTEKYSEIQRTFNLDQPLVSNRRSHFLISEEYSVLLILKVP